MHGEKVHRILYLTKLCYYPGYMGTVDIMGDLIEGEGKCEDNSVKEE